MTASHLHIIPTTGPVKLIGLPPNSAITNTMGVTNARILHRHMLNNSDMNMNNNNNNNNNTLNLLSAKRCLFGSPDPGEIQNIYKEEMRRNRDHFIKRYNYDIFSEKFIEPQTNDENNKINDVKEKVVECEQRLHGKFCDDDDTNTDENDDTESYDYNSYNSDSSCNSIYNRINVNKILTTTTTAATTTTTTTKAIETISHNSNSLVISTKERRCSQRLKPYSRQVLITDFYCNRKKMSNPSTLVVKKLRNHRNSEVIEQQHQNLHQFDEQY